MNVCHCEHVMDFSDGPLAASEARREAIRLAELSFKVRASGFALAKTIIGSVR